MSSLESQIASLKDELAGLYRTQSQNAQRLLSLSDVLRDTEDKARDELDQRKSLRLELEKTHRRTTDLDASLKEKEKMIVHLNDELQTVHLEFTQLEEKNKSLVKDNKNLLQRWLDRMNQEALQVNEANAFIVRTVSYASGRRHADIDLCRNLHAAKTKTRKIQDQALMGSDPLLEQPLAVALPLVLMPAAARVAGKRLQHLLRLPKHLQQHPRGPPRQNCRLPRSPRDIFQHL